MQLYSDPTTHRLEDAARHWGLAVGVSVGEPSEDGHYFLTSLDGHPVATPVPLGFTDEQALWTLHRMAAYPAWLRGEREV